MTEELSKTKLKEAAAARLEAEQSTFLSWLFWVAGLAFVIYWLCDLAIKAK